MCMMMGFERLSEIDKIARTSGFASRFYFYILKITRSPRLINRDLTRMRDFFIFFLNFSAIVYVDLEAY